jgi:hypothetical protein
MDQLEQGWYEIKLSGATCSRALRVRVALYALILRYKIHMEIT